MGALETERIVAQALAKNPHLSREYEVIRILEIGSPVVEPGRYHYGVGTLKIIGKISAGTHQVSELEKPLL